jgi:hypothetical protein
LSGNIAMNLIKASTFIAIAIAASATASLADNVSGKTQEANLSTTTVGHGNVTVTDTKQQILDIQKAGRGTNVSGAAQKINTDSTTLGTNNVDIKKVVQEAIGGQVTK